MDRNAEEAVSGTTDAGSLLQSGRPSGGSRLSARSLLAVTHGILAGVGGVYLATVSLPVTLIAAVSAVLLASLIVIAYR